VKAKGPVPLGVLQKVAMVPSQALAGAREEVVVLADAVRVAQLCAVPQAPVTVTQYWSTVPPVPAVAVKQLFVAPAIVEPFLVQA
jgi:hypothetical protein